MRINFLYLVANCTCLLISLSQAELCNPHDKKALLQIKKSLGDPYILTSWKNTTDCCTDWYVVTCDSKTNRIISMFMVDKGPFPGQTPAIGAIPAALGDLPFLQELSLHKLPNVTGPIPPEITKLKHLTSLTFDFLNLSGPIPSFLSQLKNLTSLNLAYNKLSGSIPGELGSLPNLQSLYLSRNNLSGPIPSALGDLKTSSIYIDLSHNQLTGEIPASFNNLNLASIDLSWNKLEGDASMLFGPNKIIATVILDRNQLEFNLTTVVFPSGFTNLDIDHNKIYGSLPPQLAELSLQFLNVSYNRLCGEIPVGGRLQSFDIYEYLHNKCLCGAPLPACK